MNETQLAEKNMRIQLPSYLQVEEEITDKPEFQPKALAEALARKTKTNVVPVVVEEEKKQVSSDDK